MMEWRLTRGDGAADIGRCGEPGQDRRDKRFKITAAGVAKLEEARPAWERAQARMQALLPEGTWQGLLAILPEVVRLTAGA